MKVPPAGHVQYHDRVLHLEGVDLRTIARQIKTPAYVYSWAHIEDGLRRVQAAVSFMPSLVAYAVKANSNLTLLRRLARLGAGMDIVSGGELARALEAGVPARCIVFSGVGKTDSELETALAVGVRSIHAESAEEVDAIEAVAASMSTRAPLSLRVNPDVDPETHPYISTGLHNAKFGIDMDTARALIPRVQHSHYLQLEGLACHIGSQLSSPEPLSDAVERMARFAMELREQGIPLRSLDAGGGWPIDYGDAQYIATDPALYGAAIRQGLERAGALDAGLSLIVEPGRSIVGDAGVLLTKVIFIKHHGGKRFVIVDAAMTELMRPALYGAYHAILPAVQAPEGAETLPADIVGPVCETGDFLALDRSFPEVARGDLLAVRGAGAYAASMASNYNSRPHAAEVLVEGDQWTVIRRRQHVEDLWRHE